MLDPTGARRGVARLHRNGSAAPHRTARACLLHVWRVRDFSTRGWPQLAVSVLRFAGYRPLYASLTVSSAGTASPAQRCLFQREAHARARRLAPFRGRVAYPSYVDESLFGNPHQDTIRKARSMPDASAFPTVLGAAEFGCMEVRARARGELTEKQQDKARLHALSNARKAKWPNTLEANRIKKENARQEKLDAEEALRKEIDAQEEALHVEKRRLAIERANKMLYDSTDRVKSLHSKLLLADVMQVAARPRPRPSPVARSHPLTLTRSSSPSPLP